MVKTLHEAFQLVLTSERHGVGISSWFALGVLCQLFNLSLCSVMSNHLLDILLKLVDAVK